MYRLARILVAIVVLSAASAAQPDWNGSYSFSEDGGKNAGGSAIFITHQLDVYEGSDGPAATIESNGYQTSANLVCSVKVEGTKLMIYFQAYGEDNMFEPYRDGDLLFTLEKKTEKGKPVLLTHWGKFTAVIEKYQTSGKVYFVKDPENK